jgi:hypothetical protein
MWPHMLQLFGRAIYAMPSRVSGNWPEVILAIFIFIVAELLTLWARGREEMKRRWLQNAGIGVVAVAIGWIALLSYSVVIEIYQDHQAMAKENLGLWQEIQVRNEHIRQLETKTCSACRPVQPTISTQPFPPKVGPITMTYSSYDSIHMDAPYCQKLIFTSEVPVQNIGLEVHFTSPVKYADSLIAFVYKGWFKVDESDQKQVDIAMLGFNGDVLLPERPIVIVVCSDHSFAPTGLRRRNVVETGGV